ncbi:MULTISPECIES: serine/threonine-protein kinase [unclassified Crossiella]|uniref:serine/threonine-protein kinase n=1 Tax=unclassified Crossiella TaxID=2620835 RepID=UPI001FFEB1A3|nr:MULTISPECIES: serine/threonine-protein kinase [unclassified Crossiella]MCK2244562.1 serine/threonine protein kinase [Crossiella sp. S99.2]MCK2258193.1 serine/threonine protein kinase [Crossiella sp. S99.1]
MQPGMVIANRYRLERVIGAGGMGVVWQATDLELRREVALKVGESEQLRREARIGAGLQHPNVIAVHDVAEQDGQRWLVLEYLPSRSLAEILHADGPVSARLAARIGGQIADALVAMHERNMVHRDITPANVLVTAEGVAKLTDLGIASWSQVTRTGSAQVAGTDGFLAPEVLAGGFATPAIDLYALGATLSAAVEGLPATGPGRALTKVLAELTNPDPQLRPSAARARELFRKAAADLPRRRKLLVTVSVGLVAVTAAAIALVPDWGAVPQQTTTAAAGATLPALNAAFVGDPRTVEACGLVDPRELDQFGATRFAAERGPFNACLLHTMLRANLEVDLYVRLETGPDVDSFEVPRPPVPVATEPVPVREEPNGDQCRRIVYLPGGYRVVISAWQNKPPPELCRMAEALVPGVLAAYHRGPLPRRVTRPGSLAARTACDLLPAEKLTGPFGTSQITREPGLGGWSCFWKAPGDDPAVQVNFYRTDPPEDGQVRTIAGHEVVLLPEGAGDNKCLASITVRRDPIERIEILWRSAQPSAQRCAAVTALATTIAESLR